MKKVYLSFLFAFLLTLVFLFINIASIYLAGPYAWDDGAISLAYSKTLAESGKFSLTAASEIVEGTSSVLFTLLMAILHFIFQFDFTSFIAASQIVSFFFLAATAIITYFAILKSGQNTVFSIIIVASFFLLPMFTSEVINGMEMTLFSFLITLYYLNFSKNIYLIMVLTPLILLTRFEAIFYLGFSIGIYYLTSGLKRNELYLGLYTLSMFLLVSLIRWNYFGDILPNTIWAKMNPPYSSDGLVGFGKKILGGIEFLKVTALLLLPVIAAFLTSLRARFIADIGVFLILSFAIFSLVAGKNTGYDGRMFLSILPVIILVIFRIASTIKNERFEISTLSRKRLMAFDKNIIIFTAVLSCIALTHITNSSLHLANIKTSLTGGFYQNRLPSEIKSFVNKNSHLTNVTSFGVTPQNYRLTGVAIDKLRMIIKRNEISFMVPDVGGLGLCCSRIKVIDSAMLTNRELAKTGYESFNNYLSKTLPDVIETHGAWSRVSKIYQSKSFKAKYKPIVFENNLFWLRDDIFDFIYASPLLSKKIIGDLSNLKSVRYADNAVDLEYLASLDLNHFMAFQYTGE